MASSSSFLAARKAAFSSSRVFFIVAMSSLTALMFSMHCAFSSLSCLIRSPSFAIFASFFSIFHVKSAIVLLILLYSSLHSSRLAMSSFVSTCNSSINLSMALITSSKWPTFANFTAAATRAKRKLCTLVACFFKAEYAFSAGAAISCEATWRNDAGAGVVAVLSEKALPNNSLASSLVRISRALPMPASSSSLRLFRCFHSSVLSVQASFVVSKNSTSAFNCASVSS
mmetsp:Transcript_119502/g.234872  ORF Transcript_119502/g.234872 Transcript_119502/m.234872 type:complete len:228 (-) Transcript_119502:1003-1686(-)